MDGLEVLAHMRERHKERPPVVMLTAHSSSGNTIEAMRLGAFDHLAKPLGRDAVKEVLERALKASAPGPVNRLVADAPDDDEFVGVSTVMREVHKRIGLAASSDAPVLIQGETGTGKEVVARALHAHSSRAAGPFVAINCAAIPQDLLESELFGHVRGAFTGAANERAGCFRAAHGGVLLLDEIGDMALTVQAKLLRVLQEGEVTPLGSHRPVKVDVRVVAATHRDLVAAVASGSFREDLRYRLDVLRIELPPLRERLADILPLAERFLRQAAKGRHARQLSNGAAEALLRHDWPGNVRELRNLMERCQVMARHEVIEPGDLGFDRFMSGASPAASGDQTLAEAVEGLERRMIAQALTQAGGNRTEAARRLGMHRQLLYRKIAQYGLE
jgi:two-component system NtrC family response regulator